jgi:hypothetical protein
MPAKTGISAFGILYSAIQISAFGNRPFRPRFPLDTSQPAV